jgi:hypothetical protein
MDRTDCDARIAWQISERQLSGTPAEVAEQIDQLILALMALRRTLPVPAENAGSTPRFRWLRRLGGFAVVLALTLLPTPTAAAQSAVAPAAGAGPWRSVGFGVSLESYFEHNANAPTDRVNALRAYDSRAGQFGLQQAAALVELAPQPDAGRRFGLRFDLQFGQATEAVQGGAANEPRPEVYRHVWQAYGSYVIPVGGGLQVDFGKFASNLGYESNYAKDNQAFSRAFLFAFLPFYHSGLRTTYRVNDRLSFMGAVVNGVQQTEDFNNGTSTHLSVTAKPASGVSWTASYYRGREQPDGGLPGGPDGLFQVFDSYLSAPVGSRVSIALDVNRTTNARWSAEPSSSLVGLAGYVSARVASATSVGLRYERLDDEGLFAGVTQVLQEVTLTLEQRLAEGLLLRAEFRRDWSNQDLFPAESAVRRAQPTVLVAGIWWFGNKNGTW